MSTATEKAPATIGGDINLRRPVTVSGRSEVTTTIGDLARIVCEQDAVGHAAFLAEVVRIASGWGALEARAQLQAVGQILSDRHGIVAEDVGAMVAEAVRIRR